MKISTKGRYGLRVMLDLARHDGEQPRAIADICEAQKLSPKYVGRLVLELLKAGLILSVRGKRGGYRIKEMPKNISLLQIVETMEGPMSIVDCTACPSNRSADCISREIWIEVNERIRNTLASISLQDILNREAANADYSI